MVAEAFEAGDDEDFRVAEPLREESGQDEFRTGDEPNLLLHATLKENGWNEFEIKSFLIPKVGERDS